MATSKEVDETIAALPFDSTPATFDTQFYLESLLNGTMYPGFVHACSFSRKNEILADGASRWVTVGLMARISVKRCLPLAV